ncbi:MAG: beta-propeller fold lactonase family protein [Deltaproteobacteria bacterium]|nr:beta-propeller fold lactonase family protein [Deltaproteobacteria bacterium]
MHFGKSCLPLSGLFPVAILTGLLTILLLPQLGWAKNTGDVYVMTNQSRRNSVMVFHRDANGNLTFAGSFSSGGKGTGTGADPLGSQGALTLSEDNRLLFAVNAGSNSVSVFAVSGDKLILLNTIASGGTMPVSVASEDNLVYALNAGGTPDISGFSLDPETNHLVPLAGSTQNLPGGAKAAPAQVSFSPEEGVLIVTEKATNLIDTFTLEDGVAQPGVSFTSNGTTPFGFSFGRDDTLIVSDADGGPGKTSALSSYEVEENGVLELITPALGDTQKAACWVVVPRDGRFAYTSNTASNTISSYTVSDDGKLALLKVKAASTGKGSVPIDMALSNNSDFLYVRNGGNGTVSGFRIHADGSLTEVTSAAGVPSGAQGIAAR